MVKNDQITNKFCKEKVMEMNSIQAKELEGLTEMQVATLLYYVLSNNDYTAYQIDVIGSMLKGLVIQKKKL